MWINVAIYRNETKIHGMTGCFSLSFVYLFIYLLSLEIKLSRRECWDHINRFISVTFVCLSQARTCISNVTCCGFFYVQWVKVGCDCSFCWHWWNCWPSLFKLSFRNYVYRFTKTIYEALCCYKCISLVTSLREHTHFFGRRLLYWNFKYIMFITLVFFLQIFSFYYYFFWSDTSYESNNSF